MCLQKLCAAVAVLLVTPLVADEIDDKIAALREQARQNVAAGTDGFSDPKQSSGLPVWAVDLYLRAGYRYDAIERRFSPRPTPRPTTHADVFADRSRRIRRQLRRATDHHRWYREQPAVRRYR